MLSLKNRFPSLDQRNLKEVEKDKTFAQLVKGTVMQAGAKVDLSFPEEVRLYKHQIIQIMKFLVVLSLRQYRRLRDSPRFRTNYNKM